MEKLLLYPNFLFFFQNKMISNILMLFFAVLYCVDVIYKTNVIIMVSPYTRNANNTKLPSAWLMVFGGKFLTKTAKGEITPDLSI